MRAWRRPLGRIRGRLTHAVVEAAMNLKERERWKRGAGVEGDMGVASLFDELTNRSIVMLIYLLIVPLLVCTDIFCVFNDRYIVHGINEDIEPVW